MAEGSRLTSSSSSSQPTLPFNFELDKVLNSAKPKKIEAFFSEESEGGVYYFLLISRTLINNDDSFISKEELSVGAIRSITPLRYCFQLVIGITP